MNIREGFLIVVIIWFGICIIAALPFVLFKHDAHTFTASVFEAVSGITTTGATNFTDLDALPHAILFYRQQLQFIGGMGIVVLAVAVFPMLGIGGVQLFRVEASGPIKDSKLTPRIAQTAKALWTIYSLIMIGCATCYWYCGMDWFHAIGESFGTVSTGGFSMHDESFVFYNSQAIEWIACVFMLLGAINFSLHYLAFQKHSLRVYWQNEEFRFYLKVFFLCVSLITLTLFAYQWYQLKPLKVIDSLFIIISISTTTGFTLYPFDAWPTFVPILIILMSLIGGCAGSTTGGIKMMRLLLIMKQNKREFVRLIHPQAVLPIKMNQQAIPELILQSITAFVAVYISVLTVLVLLFMGFDNDFTSSFSLSAAGLANSGAGIGSISDSFNNLNVASKWLFILSMIIGRLEIFSLLVLFSRTFWKK